MKSEDQDSGNVTRVGLLEWACCGGLFVDDLTPAECPFLGEGHAMLSTLMQAASARTLAESIVDPRLTSQVHFPVHQSLELATSELDGLLECWQAFTRHYDACLVVVPECDHLLQSTIEVLSRSGVHLINCRPKLIELAADKWLTHQFLERHQLPHIPTVLASELETAWLEDICASESSIHKVAKPRLGAAAEGLMVSPVGQDFSFSEPEELIVQPWLDGTALSCSAIVDCVGNWHWLPPVEQHFIQDSKENAQRLKYTGGRLRLDWWEDAPLQLLLSNLEAALDQEHPCQAHGWFSVDLLRRKEKWSIVELNPRCTTSIALLQESSLQSLVTRLLESGFAALPPNWPASIGWRPAELTAKDLNWPLP